MRGRAVTPLLALLALACSADPLTEIVVVADTDLAVPRELDAIRIVVTDEQGQEREALADLAAGAPRPVTLDLVARNGLRTLGVVVIGELGGVEMLRRTARVRFRERRTVALRMDLWSACRGELCGAERTCGDDGCRSVEIADADLSDWTGEPPSPRAPDASATMDAGVPMDASMPRDARVDAPLQRDAQVPLDAGLDAPIDARMPIDAPPDAYEPPDAWVPECMQAEECDDGWSCTQDACTEGRCTHVPLDEACDDGIDCTTQRCDVVLGCVYDARDERCEDGHSCTTHTCDPLVGCRTTALHSMCGSGNYCDSTTGCTTAPTFTEVYTTVITPRCGPCHLTSATRGGMLDMATQEMAYSELVGVTATCGGGVNTIVIPGDASRSLLWRKVAAVDL